MENLWNKWGTALAGPVLMILVLAVWRYTDDTAAEIHWIDTELRRIDTRLDTKFDALNTLLTENFIAMKGEIRELKGQAQSHTPEG